MVPGSSDTWDFVFSHGVGVAMEVAREFFYLFALYCGGPFSSPDNNYNNDDGRRRSFSLWGI